MGLGMASKLHEELNVPLRPVVGGLLQTAGRVRDGALTSGRRLYIVQAVDCVA